MAAQGPSRLWYVAAAVVLVAALATAGLLGWRSVASIGGTLGEFGRVPVPGTARLNFDEAGGYVLYYEGGQPPSLDITVEPVEGGEPLRVVPYLADLTYTWGGRTGVAVASVDIPAPGRYLLAVDGPAEGGSLAVGPSIAGNVFGSVGGIFAAAGIGLLGIGAAVAIIVVVAVRRSRARKAATTAPPPATPPATPF